MTGQAVVRAGWALWGKKPGSRDDYSVLACSAEPFTKAEFSTIITRFSAGTPDTGASGPGQLPWVTLSWVGVDDGLHLGIAVTTDTGHVDGVGRPITQTAYFCVPYADAAAASLGYSALYRAVSGITLPWPDGGAIPLPVDRITPADAANTVATRFGELAPASAAALLLRGPVSVLQAEGSSLRERLEFIDAVASLLPYGYRARFSAGTWSDSGTRHRLRLAFAARSREDATAVAWRRSGDPPAAGDVAREYFDQFHALRDKTPASGRVFELPAILAHLAADTTPRRFEQPRAAVDSLRQIDLPFRLERALHDGAQVDLADLRQVFRQGPTLDLESSGRVMLLKALSEQGEASDWAVLSQHLNEVPDREALTQILGTFAQRTLWISEPGGSVIRECREAAAQFDIEDGVLALLLVPPDSVQGQPRASRFGAELMAKIVTADLKQGPVYPRTREALAGAPATVAAYLAALGDHVADASRCVGWLSPVAPRVLIKLFAIALGMANGEIKEQDLMQLANLGPGCVSALLEVASHARRVDAVLPDCARWLAAGGSADSGVVESLRVLDVTAPRQRAWLDMALLSAGAGPSALPPLAGQSDSENYLTELAGIWRALKRYALFDSDRCVRSLANYLDKQPWTATKEQAEAVVGLSRELREYDSEQVLRAAVTGGLAAAPDAKRWEFARLWLAEVQAEDPGIMKKRVRTSLAQAAPGTEADQLAALCVQAYKENIPANEAFRLLAYSHAIDSAAKALAVMHGLRDEFGRSGIPNSGQVTDNWVIAYAEAFGRGEFGERLARDFHELYWRRARDFIRVDLNVISFLASAGHFGQYELSGDEREWLTVVRDTISFILKKSPKKSLKRLSAGPND